MTAGDIATIVILVVLVAVVLLSSVRVVRPDERGVVFRFGRAQPSVREPGMTMVVPTIDRLQRVPMQPRVAEVPADEVATRDGVAMWVGAAVHVRVVDPLVATLSVADHLAAVAQLTATMLRSFIGHCDFAELAGTDHAQVNAQLRELVAEAAEESWGLRIERLELVVPKTRTEDSSSAPR